MKDWAVTAGTISHGPKGAGFSIKQRGDAPTMQTKFNIFFGRVEASMVAAPGQGVISSFILESDDLDEIDWVSRDEMLLQMNHTDMNLGICRKRYCQWPEQLLRQG